MYRDLGDLFKLKEVAGSPWNYPGSNPLPWATDIFILDSYVVNFFFWQVDSMRWELGTQITTQGPAGVDF